MQQILNNKKQILIALLVIGLFIGLIILIITNNSDDANKTTTGNNASSQTVDTPPITNSNGDTTEDTNETTPEDTNPTPDDDSSTSSTSTTTRLVSTTSVVVQPTTTTDPQTTPEASSNNQQSPSSNNYVGNTLQSDDDNDQQTPSSVQQQSQSSSDNVKVPLPYTIKHEKHVTDVNVDESRIFHIYTVEIDPEYITKMAEQGISTVVPILLATYVDNPCTKDLFMTEYARTTVTADMFLDADTGQIQADSHKGNYTFALFHTMSNHDFVGIQPHRITQDIKFCSSLELEILVGGRKYIDHYQEFIVRKADLLTPGIHVIQEETSVEEVVDGVLKFVEAIEINAYHYNVPNFDYTILSRDVAYSGISNCPINNNQLDAGFFDSDWVHVYSQTVDGVTKEYHYKPSGESTYIRSYQIDNPGLPLDNSDFAAPVIFLKSELEGITNCTVNFAYHIKDTEGNTIDTLRTTYTVVVD